MILVSAGLPGRFAESCERLLGALAAASGAQGESFNADSLEALGAALLGRDATTALAVTRQPAADLAAHMKAHCRPFAVALEPPQACVAALMQDHGQSFLDAVRAAANSCAAIFALLDHPGVLVLRQEDGRSPCELAQALAAHYRLCVPPGQITALATTLAENRATLSALSPYAPPPEGPQGLGADRLLPQLLPGALAPADAWLHTGQLQDVTWHRDLFFSGDSPGQPPAPRIDVTGAARCLFYGPYIRLPPANWSCALLLGCGADAVGLTLAAEIFAGEVLGRAEFTVSEAGFFELEFSFTLSGDWPVEIRLFTPRAAFEGHIALVQAALRPLKAVRLPLKAG